MRFTPSLVMLAAVAIAAPASAVPILYGVTFSNTLDTSTGASTFVGNLTTAMDPIDLAAYRGNLYTYDELAVFTGDHHGLIRQLDPATGATVNTIDIGFYAFGEGAMAINPATGTGYLEGLDSMPYFYSFQLSPLTGRAIGFGNTFLDGLAFSPSGVLYGITEPRADVTGNARLVIVDPLTGAETVVGTNTGVIKNAVLGGLAFAPDGTLYAEESDDVAVTDLYTIDITTGRATLIGSNNERFSGIAFLDTSSVPEPPSFVLAMLGILIGGLAWDRRSGQYTLFTRTLPFRPRAPVSERIGASRVRMAKSIRCTSLGSGDLVRFVRGRCGRRVDNGQDNGQFGS